MKNADYMYIFIVYKRIKAKKKNIIKKAYRLKKKKIKVLFPAAQW